LYLSRNLKQSIQRLAKLPRARPIDIARLAKKWARRKGLLELGSISLDLLGAHQLGDAVAHQLLKRGETGFDGYFQVHPSWLQALRSRCDTISDDVCTNQP
jgi:hypothetical protein